MIPLSIALGDYDVNRGLIDSQVEVTGCRLTVIPGLPSPERHWRFLRHEEFDACELSLGSFLADFSSGRFVAVPAFPHRRFRHHYYFVNRQAGIRSPKDLEGRSVGLRTWQTTAGIWMRGILAQEYGVDLRKVRWVTQSEEDITSVHPPVTLHRAERDLEAMLLDGEIDAVMYPEMLPSFAKGDPRVARLFPDPKAEEQAYYQRTGIFPIMHLLAIRRSVVEANPWVPVSLLKAWEASKDRAMKRLQNPRTVSLAWLTPLLEEEHRILGPDPWQVGLTPGNRKALETALQYAYDQGILAQNLDVETLFWPSTLDELPHYVGG